jgi:hypothetical protein
MSVAEKANENLTASSSRSRVGGERALVLGAGVAPCSQNGGFAEPGGTKFFQEGDAFFCPGNSSKPVGDIGRLFRGKRLL